MKSNVAIISLILFMMGTVSATQKDSDYYSVSADGTITIKSPRQPISEHIQLALCSIPFYLFSGIAFYESVNYKSTMLGFFGGVLCIPAIGLSLNKFWLAAAQSPVVIVSPLSFSYKNRFELPWSNIRKLYPETVTTYNETEGTKKSSYLTIVTTDKTYQIDATDLSMPLPLLIALLKDFCHRERIDVIVSDTTI